MNEQEMRDVVQRYFTALRRDKSEASLREYVAEEPLLQHIAFFEAAFPGYWLEAEDMMADSDKVAVRFTFHGTHQGELMGIPPTGKTASMEGIIIYRLADGKIVDHWMQTDTVGLLQQLGAMPAAA
jgi:predicted ester cyclase